MAGNISLTTDFGLADEYVGVMKGVIYKIAPAANIVDITHAIRPQDIRQAAYAISFSYRYLPEGSIHVLVVDPGVGSNRKIILICAEKHFFLAPDNGLLTLIMDSQKDMAAYHVTNRDLFLPQVSGTFHGRDIMAPVAAHLAAGNITAAEVGPKCELDELTKIKISRTSLNQGQSTITGRVIHIDHYGNLLTDISRDTISTLQAPHPGKQLIVSLDNQTIFGLSSSYSNVKPNEPLAIIGSRDHLEISLNHGNSAIFFDAEIDDTVTVSVKE